MSLKLDNFILNAILSYEKEKGISDMWKKPPLTAVLSANHPQLYTLWKIVSPDHFLPEEILKGAKSIVVYFIPFENRIIESNLTGDEASPDWAEAYVQTNNLFEYINAKIALYLDKSGFATGIIKPVYNDKTLVSRWSHRHIAWLAGMGTFGLNNMLITSKGCCGRISSFVTNADCIELDIPLLGDSALQSEKCLDKRKGRCGVCRRKCPAGAYDAQGNFSRHKCYELCLKNGKNYKYLGKAEVCGKCLVGLPCSSKDPCS